MTTRRAPAARPNLTGLRVRQRRLDRSRERADRDLADRDAELVRLAADEGASYRDLAEATGLSLAAVGKIVSAGGVQRYKRRGTAATVNTGEDT